MSVTNPAQIMSGWFGFGIQLRCRRNKKSASATGLDLCVWLRPSSLSLSLIESKMLFSMLNLGIIISLALSAWRTWRKAGAATDPSTSALDDNSFIDHLLLRHTDRHGLQLIHRGTGTLCSSWELNGLKNKNRVVVGHRSTVQRHFQHLMELYRYPDSLYLHCYTPEYSS